MPWARWLFKGNKVWAAVDDAGALAENARGRVSIRYRREDPRSYQVAARNLQALPEGELPSAEGERMPRERAEQASAEELADASAPAGAEAPASPRARRRSPAPAASAGPEIHAWTDGACTGNPGPMGIGVVLLSGRHRKEISEYLGPRGTNNIAELVAIERALEAIKDRGRRVVVYSDSSYAIGLLSQGWKAKANAELVQRLRRLVAEFAHLRFVKVAGHAGVAENERCDELARHAIVRGLAGQA
jgi:ribonuclease HI